MLHKERHHHGINGYHHIEHHHRAGLTQILRPKHHNETREEAKQHQNVDKLPDDGILYLGLRHVTACRFFLKRCQNTIRIVVHNLAAVDYFLTRQHHATCQWHRPQQIV